MVLLAYPREIELTLHPLRAKYPPNLIGNMAEKSGTNDAVQAGLWLLLWRSCRRTLGFSQIVVRDSPQEGGKNTIRWKEPGDRGIWPQEVKEKQR